MSLPPPSSRRSPSRRSSCDKPSVALPPTRPVQRSSQPRNPMPRCRRRTTLAVGVALCNDVLLLLMLVPMLPHLLPAGSSALALSFVFGEGRGALLLAPLAGALTLRFGARRDARSPRPCSPSRPPPSPSPRREGCARSSPRARRGAASAALMSGGLTLVAETHPPAERASAIARAQAGLGVGAAIGPVFGGLMLEAAGRRGAFYSAAALRPAQRHRRHRGRPRRPAARAAFEPGAAARGAGGAAQSFSLLGNRAIATVALGIFAEYAAGGCYDVTLNSPRRDVGRRRGGASLAFALEPITYLVALLAPLARRRPRWATAQATLCGGRPRARGAFAADAEPGRPPLVGRRLLVAARRGLRLRRLDAPLLADLVDAGGAEGSYAMAFALADVADSARLHRGASARRGAGPGPRLADQGTCAQPLDWACSPRCRRRRRSALSSRARP